MTKDNTPREIRIHSAENIALSSNSNKKEWIHVTDYESALQELREENSDLKGTLITKNERLHREEQETQSLQAKVERLEKMINGFVSDYKSCVSSREVDEKICKRDRNAKRSQTIEP